MFIGQSSETPGALESGMRRSSGGLRDGIARADVSIQDPPATVVLVARGVCFRLVLTSLWCAGEALLPGRESVVHAR